MKYTLDDLDYIFVRAKDSKGKFGNYSLSEIIDDEFYNFVLSFFHGDLFDFNLFSSIMVNPVCIIKNRLKTINNMAKYGVVFCMIKKSARKDFI